VSGHLVIDCILYAVCERTVSNRLYSTVYAVCEWTIGRRLYSQRFVSRLLVIDCILRGLRWTVRSRLYSKRFVSGLFVAICERTTGVYAFCERTVSLM
jgi:hypothetical protein